MRSPLRRVSIPDGALTLVVLIAVAAVVLPMFLGRLTNDLLTNVGLFLLLALGLNIVSIAISNIGIDKSFVDDFVCMGYCKHESRLCPTIC